MANCFIFFLFLFLFVFPGVLRAAFTGWQREVVDWGIIGVTGGGGFLFKEMDPFFDSPLIDGSGDMEYREEQIPNSWVYGAMFGLIGAASLLPNQDGWLNGRSYRHFKGATQAVTSGFFIKEFTKDLVGRPRPDYYYRMDNDIEVEKARKSWPSGHATHFTTAAVYLTLFTWDEWRCDDAWALAVKGGLTALLAAGAGYVCYSRVADNRHYPGDVIAGALLGAGTTLLCYSYQNWWGNTISGSDTGGTSSLQISPVYLGFRFTF